jgi:hypothetical protein
LFDWVSSVDSETDNPLDNPQRGDIGNGELLSYFQAHRVIPRLSVIIASGFANRADTPWTDFLVRGLYDPRLFLFIFDFVFDLFIRKRGRFEE